MAATQRGLLADDPGLQGMPVAGLQEGLCPCPADSRAVGREVLDVVDPEVPRDLVECLAAVGCVPRVEH